MSTDEKAPVTICCFCGLDINPIEADPLTIGITTRQGAWQGWFAHAACFKRRISTDRLVDLSPVHF